MNSRLHEPVLAIAGDAADVVAKETGNADHRWAKIFRDMSEDQQLTRRNLHAALRDASDVLSRKFPDIAARLSELCRLLDGLPR
jgi:hypothetical protein